MVAAVVIAIIVASLLFVGCWWWWSGVSEVEVQMARWFDYTVYKTYSWPRGPGERGEGPPNAHTAISICGGRLMQTAYLLIFETQSEPKLA